MEDQTFQERVRFFQEFLDEDQGFNKYKLLIRKMFDKGENRLLVNIADLRNQSEEYAKGVLFSPMEFIPAFDKALKDVVQAQLEPQQTDTLYHVGFEGSFGNNFVSPREICSRYIGKMISIEGIVTRCSLVRPKVAKSVHYCEATQLFHAKEYRDGFSLENQMPTGSIYPKTVFLADLRTIMETL
jgi:DNA replication licensing factor MCM3